MPSLLYEVAPGYNGPVGFGTSPGIAFAYGAPSPLGTWTTIEHGTVFGLDFFSCHSFGWWTGAPSGGNFNNSEMQHNSLDDINLDETIIEAGAIFDSDTDYGPIGIGIASNDGNIGGPGTSIGPLPILIGGSGVRTYWGNVGIPNTTGDVAVTGVGFKPDAVIFSGPIPPGGGDGGIFGLGAMDADGNQWAMAGCGVFGSAATFIGGIVGYNYRTSDMVTDSCLLVLDTTFGGAWAYGNAQPRQRAQFVSMDTDGFTIDVVETGTGGVGTATFNFLAIKIDAPLPGAPQTGIKVGIGTQGDTVWTGLGFQPDALFMASAGRAAGDPTPPTWNDNMMSMGASDGTTQRATTSGSLSGGGVGSYYDEAVCILTDKSTGTETIGGFATLTSFDTDGFTIDWTTDDGHGCSLGWVAFYIPNRQYPLLDNRLPI